MHRHTFLATVAAGISGIEGLSAAFAQFHAGCRWSALQKLLDDYVTSWKLAGAAAAVSFGGSPVAYA